jgi:hypothetical protein
MNSNQHIESGTILGTISGTGLTVFANIDSHDIIKTVILAAIGAVVSFCVSVVLKEVVKKLWGYIKRKAKQN